MATYKSSAHIINQPIETTFDSISNLSRLQGFLDQLPQDQLAQIGEVRFTDDAIIIKAAAVGEITLRIIERIAPSRVKLAAVGAPVKMETAINLDAQTPDTTSLQCELDVDIPMMLKPMIGPKMQEAADRMADLIVTLLNK